MKVWIDRGLERECTFTATRSSGAGGQHVNKTATKAELTLHIATAPLFTEAERARILDRLAHRITDGGYLRVSCDRSRSQATNRAEALDKLCRMLDHALAADRVRKATKPSVHALLARREQKKIKSARKAERRFHPKDWR